MKVGLLKVKNTEKAYTLGKMVIDTMVNSHTIKDKDLVNITGVMVVFTRESGKPIE